MREITLADYTENPLTLNMEISKECIESGMKALMVTMVLSAANYSIDARAGCKFDAEVCLGS